MANRPQLIVWEPAPPPNRMAAGVVDEDEAGFRVMLLLIVTKLVEITDFDMLATLVDVIGIKDEIAVVLVDDVTGTVGRAVVISET